MAMLKGVTVKSLQNGLKALLDKIDQLLTTEPARMIGYGAAIVIYLAARVMADRGYLQLPLTFDQSLTAALAAMSTVIIIVESIRRFVYSPMTYIEDLSDEAQAAHEAAHIEEAVQKALEAIKAKRAAEAVVPEAVVPVGSVKPAGSDGKLN
jgi:hypothetical protein